MVSLDVAQIRTDGGTQTRAALSDVVVADYAEAMTGGVSFPPVVVYYDGTIYWLADGFHRLAAYQRIGAQALPVDVRQGTCRDAILYSVGANASHGLRRTNADKRRAVDVLLADAEWRRKSDRWIAARAGVTHPYVARIRGGNGYQSSSTPDDSAAVDEPEATPAPLDFAPPAEPNNAPAKPPAAKPQPERSAGADNAATVRPAGPHAYINGTARDTARSAITTTQIARKSFTKDDWAAFSAAIRAELDQRGA